MLPQERRKNFTKLSVLVEKAILLHNIHLPCSYLFAALSQLDTACRTPADKAAVMVAAHKSLVGLYFVLFDQRMLSLISFNRWPIETSPNTAEIGRRIEIV